MLRSQLTRVLPADTEGIKQAAEVIKNGGLVAFPTETVYGLGADAYSAAAVNKVYEAKGRPSDNPLILHIAERGQVSRLVKNIPPCAEALMNAFWPGPMTLLFEKNSETPTAALAGLSTVGIRLPRNAAARHLIETAGVPIAAPSANSSGKPSPTAAGHVLHDLDGKVDMILDGGACEFGLESTIVDITGEIPLLLRPGSVTLRMLEEAVGRVDTDPCCAGKLLKKDEKPKAPGTKYKHYSPDAEVRLASSAGCVAEAAKLYPQKKIAVLATDETKSLYDALNATVLSMGSRDNLPGIAKNLFRYLRLVDELEIDLVFAETFDETEVGLAIMNRLKKAAGGVAQ